MRRVPREAEYRPPREERIIIYASRENKKRWERLYVDMDARNYEEALMLLLDIYELSRKYLGLTRLEDIKKKLEEILGVSVKMRIAGP